MAVSATFESTSSSYFFSKSVYLSIHIVQSFSFISHRYHKFASIVKVHLFQWFYSQDTIISKCIRNTHTYSQVQFSEIRICDLENALLSAFFDRFLLIRSHTYPSRQKKKGRSFNMHKNLHRDSKLSNYVIPVPLHIFPCELQY